MKPGHAGLSILLAWSAIGCVQSTRDDSRHAELRQLARRDQIEIRSTDLSFPVQTTHGSIDGQVASSTAVQNYAALFATEFALYPVTIIQRTNLKRVVLCTELSFAGQRRNAIPDFEHDTLYLDVVRGGNQQTYLRKVIHHEFFHIIDFRDDGKIYEDERWAALNPDDFRYGKGGKAVQDQRDTSLLTNEWPGFLNHYSTTGVEEDKAELFANLIVDAAYVDERVAQDTVLKEKVVLLKQSLGKFCPELNDRFWQQARHVDRSQR